MIISIMLYMGAKQNKSLYFVPWLTENVIGLCAGITHALIMAMSGFLVNAHVIRYVLIGFLIVSLSTFCIYSVLSHFLLLRKMKKHSKEIINSVMSGNGYQTTNYDRMTEELGREMTVISPGSGRGRAGAGQQPEDKMADRDDVLYFSL